MKFTATISSVVLLAIAAWAAPSSPKSPLARRKALAGTSPLQSAFKQPYIGSSDEFSVSDSTNWAGAVLETTGVTSVTGTFTIPTPSVPSGGKASTEYCGAAWVGIDGDTCQTGLIQTGVFWCVQNGAYSYEAWYEWIPQSSIAYSGLTVSAGNVITVTVTKTSSTSGTTTLKNVSTGKTATHTFTSQRSGTLCGQNAEWIVEDFESGSSLVPFANFGSVTFTGATAVVGGKTVTAGGDNADTIILVSSSNKALTSTTVSGSTVVVSYV